MKVEPVKPESSNDARSRSVERGLVRMEVAVSDLVPDVDNRTIDEAEDEFLTLVDSVRVLRVLVALQVRRDAVRFKIVDGERRWRAAKQAGLATVPCDVWPEHTNPRDVALAGVVINEQRQAHSSLAVARRLRAVKNQFAESHEQLAARDGHAAAAHQVVPEPIQRIGSPARVPGGGGGSGSHGGRARALREGTRQGGHPAALLVRRQSSPQYCWPR